MKRPIRTGRSAPSRAALQTSLVYAVIATGWILPFDWLLALPDIVPRGSVLWATTKGLGLVAITSLLLFVLLRAHLRRQPDLDLGAGPRRTGSKP